MKVVNKGFPTSTDSAIAFVWMSDPNDGDLSFVNPLRILSCTLLSISVTESRWTFSTNLPIILSNTGYCYSSVRIRVIYWFPLLLIHWSYNPCLKTLMIFPELRVSFTTEVRQSASTSPLNLICSAVNQDISAFIVFIVLITCS